MTHHEDDGRIVWHDLITPDLEGAIRFYSELLGWEVRVEHAEEFVWSDGDEADYPLIMAHGEAHGGFVESSQWGGPSWVAYVAVENPDALASRVSRLGGTVEREPFDVPGVGRSTLVRDDQGALIGAFARAHDYAAPSGTFRWNVLFCQEVEAARAFYAGSFGWKAREVAGSAIAFFRESDMVNTAWSSFPPEGIDGPARWIPIFPVADSQSHRSKATQLGAVASAEFEFPAGRRAFVLQDPSGALFGLSGA